MCRYCVCVCVCIINFIPNIKLSLKSTNSFYIKLKFFLDQYVKHKIIDVFIEREDGSLGIVLRGGAHPDPDMCKPLTVTHVRPDGPADRQVK